MFFLLLRTGKCLVGFLFMYFPLGLKVSKIFTCSASILLSILLPFQNLRSMDSVLPVTPALSVHRRASLNCSCLAASAFFLLDFHFFAAGTILPIGKDCLAYEIYPLARPNSKKVGWPGLWGPERWVCRRSEHLPLLQLCSRIQGCLFMQENRF